jgi:hypothetical protein
MAERGQGVETAPVRRSTSREPLLVAVALVVLVLLVAKPWGGPSDGQPSDPRGTAASPFAFRTPSATAAPKIALPIAAFHPSLGACYRDSGWRVCLLDEAGGQRVQSAFARNDRQFTPDPTPLPAPDVPAVLLLAGQSSGLGFYPAASETDMAVARIAVAAWRVDELTTGTRSLALVSIGPLAKGDAVAANVFLPPFDASTGIAHWPAGRYVFRFQAASGRDWEQYFAIDVVVEAAWPGPSCPEPSTDGLSVPGPDAGIGASPPAAACPGPG